MNDNYELLPFNKDREILSFNINEEKQIRECEYCYFYLYHSGQSTSLLDQENQIFYLEHEQVYYASYGHLDCIYIKVKLIKVLQVVEKERYQILNLLIMNEEKQLQVLNLINYACKSLQALSKMLILDQTYAITLQLINDDYVFEFRQYSDAKTIKGILRLIHQHPSQNSVDIQDYPNLKIQNMLQIYDDYQNRIVHKVYNVLGVLKYVSIEKLNNFVPPEQNAIACLHLNDRNQQFFKAKVWGNYEEFCKLKMKSIMLLKNYKIDYQYMNNQYGDQSQNPSPFSKKQLEIQIQSIGFSRYDINPSFISPDDQQQLEYIKNKTFFSSISELNQINGFADEIVITEMLIEVAYLEQSPLKMTFQDVNFQSITVIVDNKELEEILRKDNLNQYSTCYFNIHIRTKINFEANGQQSIAFYLQNLN